MLLFMGQILLSFKIQTNQIHGIKNSELIKLLFYIIFSTKLQNYNTITNDALQSCGGYNAVYTSIRKNLFFTGNIRIILKVKKQGWYPTPADIVVGLYSLIQLLLQTEIQGLTAHSLEYLRVQTTTLVSLLLFI